MCVCAHMGVQRCMCACVFVCVYRAPSSPRPVELVRGCPSFGRDGFNFPLSNFCLRFSWRRTWKMASVSHKCVRRWVLAFRKTQPRTQPNFFQNAGSIS